jgi:hypothetical protein
MMIELAIAIWSIVAAFDIYGSFSRGLIPSDYPSILLIAFF